VHLGSQREGLRVRCSRAWYSDRFKKKIESIKNLGEPKCKKDAQKLLGKINYLSRIISNLAGRVESFLPLVRLKHEGEFVWGTEQRMAFDKIKEYLNSPPVLGPKSCQSMQVVHRSTRASNRSGVDTGR
jgi:hypothetical protein